MGYETETKQNVSVGQRIAQGISGAMKGAGEVVDWQLRMQQAQNQQKELQSKMQLQELQMQEAQMKMYDISDNQQSEIFNGAINSSDVVGSMNSSKESYQRHQKVKGDNTPWEVIVERTKNAASIIQPLNLKMDSATSVLSDPRNLDPRDPKSYEKIQLAYKEGNQILRQKRASVRDPWFQKQVDVEQKQHDERNKNAMDTYSKNYQALQLAQSKKETATKGDPDAERRGRVEIDKLKTEFIKVQGKAESEMLDFGAQAKSALELGGKENMAAAVNIGQQLMAKTFNGGRPTEPDFKLIQGNPSLVSALKRFVDAKVNNKRYDGDTKDMKMVIEYLYDKAEDRYIKKAQGFAKSRIGKGRGGVTADEFLGDILLEKGMDSSRIPAGEPAVNVKKAMDGLKF